MPFQIPGLCSVTSMVSFPRLSLMGKIGHNACKQTQANAPLSEKQDESLWEICGKSDSK